MKVETFRFVCTEIVADITTSQLKT